MITTLVAPGLGLGVAGIASAAGGGPALKTDRGCYVVGHSVRFTGSGFAPNREFEISIDRVDFGQGNTNSSGGFSNSLLPGGLGAGVAQHVDHLEATDGTSSADTIFTVTRKTGGRFLATSGNPHTLRSRFQVWDFSPSGISRPVYLHYVSPSGKNRMTANLGGTTGQCGYLLTGRRRVFPFTPSVGTWTLQLDTHSGYARRPTGPVARIHVKIS